MRRSRGGAGGVTFVPDPGFESELLRSAAVRDLLAELAETGAALYREGVPVDSEGLKESVFSAVALTSEGWVARVGAKAPHAGLVELGTSKRAPDGSLRRAIEAAGFTIGEVGL